MEVEEWDYSDKIKNEELFQKENKKKYPEITYVNMKLMINKCMQLWVDDFLKAFKLLDKENEYNIHILLKADSCVTDGESIKIQNLKKITIIDK